MPNAKEEFIEHIENREVLCATIGFIDYKDYSITQSIFLMLGYGPNEYDDFLSKIDKVYDDGYGTQELDGIIWYTDGTWSWREEYDGAEWWVHVQRPDIPVELRA